MRDREPHKRDPNAGVSLKRSFDPTSGLVTTLAALPPALGRRIVGLEETAFGESRLR
jgi:hypothetical protein